MACYATVSAAKWFPPDLDQVLMPGTGWTQARDQFDHLTAFSASISQPACSSFLVGWRFHQQEWGQGIHF